MPNNTRSLVPAGLAIFGLGMIAGFGVHLRIANAQAASRVFELRTYTANPGRLERLNRRFGDHTIQLFEKHGMTNVGYFIPQDEPLSENTFIYLLAHDSRAAAEASWAAFRSDPEWQRISEETQRDGRLAQNIVSVFLEPTSYSALQ